jgi:hypothetical protein
MEILKFWLLFQKDEWNIYQEHYESCGIYFELHSSQKIEPSFFGNFFEMLMT